MGTYLASLPPAFTSPVPKDDNNRESAKPAKAHAARMVDGGQKGAQEAPVARDKKQC